jgi:hypothetical protein
MIKSKTDNNSTNTIRFQNESPVEEPPNRPKKPPVKEPENPPEPSPPPAVPPVKEPPDAPQKPPVKEPPPKATDRESPQKPPIKVLNINYGPRCIEIHSNRSDNTFHSLLFAHAFTYIFSANW